MISATQTRFPTSSLLPLASRFLAPSAKGRRCKAHLTCSEPQSLCSKGFASVFAQSKDAISVGTSNINTIQISIKTRGGEKRQTVLGWAVFPSTPLLSLPRAASKTHVAAPLQSRTQKPTASQHAALCYETNESQLQKAGACPETGKRKGFVFELSQKDSWLRKFSHEPQLLLFPLSEPNASPWLRI